MLARTWELKEDMAEPKRLSSGPADLTRETMEENPATGLPDVSEAVFLQRQDLRHALVVPVQVE